MTMRLLDPTTVFKHGLDDPDALDRFELLVYLVQNLECCMDMEGWDHFFMYGRADHSELVRKMLREVGDSTSAEIIDHYADHLRQIGDTFPPRELPCRSCVDDRDWRDDFAAATEVRWRIIEEFLRRHEVQLLVH